MLAAESARAVLSAEHEKIRELLSQLDEGARAGSCASAIQAKAVLRLVERLRAFDEATHRPKGVMLMSALRGRSTEVDDLLQRLAAMRHQGDVLLSRVRSKLKDAAKGDLGAALEVESLLADHRTLTLAHLDAEDSLLHLQSTVHLTRDEWAAIASSISRAMVPARR